MGLFVVSNLGGAAEMVLPGGTASPFPAGDTMSLISLLQTLSAPLKREAVGRAASQFVATKFAPDRMLDNYKETF
jgi:hypothetical protein